MAANKLVQNKLHREFVKLLTYVKNVISYFLFICVHRFLTSENREKSKNILIVNTGQIGDLLLFTVLMENYEQSSSSFGLFVLIKEEYKTVFEGYHGKVKLIFFNYNKYRFSPIYRIKFLNTLRRINFSIAANVTTARGPINDELTLLSGAVTTKCFQYNSEYLTRALTNHYNKLYSEIIEFSRMLEIDRYLSIYQTLFGNCNSRQTRLHVDSKSIESLHEKLTRKGISKNSLIVIAPFTDLKIKNWGSNNYIKLLEKLTSYWEKQIILIGTKKQKRDIAKLALGFNSRVHSLAGELSLPETFALIKISELFIGNDSGLTHAAKALGKNYVAITGGGSYNLFFPYNEQAHQIELHEWCDFFGCEWRCKFSIPKCLTDITAEQVFEAIKKKI